MIDLDGLSGDDDLQRSGIGERERHVAGTDLDPQTLASPAKSEGQPGKGGRQLRVEVELLGDEAPPPEALDERDPGPRERGHAEPVAGVLVTIAQVDSGSLCEVVERQVEVAHPHPDPGAGGGLPLQLAVQGAGP